MVDTELLIACVFQRSSLWDKRLKVHANRNVTDKYWKEITAILNAEEHVVRKKWKYLRDQFAAELAKIKPPRSGDAASDRPTSKWQHFDSLLFLKDVVKPRQSSGNLFTTTTSASAKKTDIESSQVLQEISEVADDDEFSQVTNDADAEYADEGEDAGTPIQNSLLNTTGAAIQGSQYSSRGPTSHKKGKGKRLTTDEFNETMLNIEKKKLQILSDKAAKSNGNNEDDEDLLFLKSLLPHIKKIPDNKKLSFRNRTMEVVEQFAYPYLYGSYPETQYSHSSTSAPASVRDLTPISTPSPQTPSTYCDLQAPSSYASHQSHSTIPFSDM